MTTEQGERYTFAAFCEAFRQHPGDRLEMLDGMAYSAPPPSPLYQEVRGLIMNQMRNIVGVHEAPFPVRLFAKPGDAPEDVTTIVQPDICVIREGTAVDEYGCEGVPVLVVELLSPERENRQRNQWTQTEKMDLYSAAGVQEVWLTDLKKREVRVYTRKGTDSPLYYSHLALQFEILHARTVEDCAVNLRDVLARRKWKSGFFL